MPRSQTRNAMCRRCRGFVSCGTLHPQLALWAGHPVAATAAAADYSLVIFAFASSCSTNSKMRLFRSACHCRACSAQPVARATTSVSQNKSRSVNFIAKFYPPAHEKAPLFLTGPTPTRIKTAAESASGETDCALQVFYARYNRSMKRHAAPIIAAVLLLLPVLYVGGYLALVQPEGAYVDLPGGGYYVSHYRIPGTFPGRFFWSLEWLDRRARPNSWYVPQPDLDTPPKFG